MCLLFWVLHLVLFDVLVLLIWSTFAAFAVVDVFVVVLVVVTSI